MDRRSSHNEDIILEKIETRCDGQNSLLPASTQGNQKKERKQPLHQEETARLKKIKHETIHIFQCLLITEIVQHTGYHNETTARVL